MKFMQIEPQPARGTLREEMWESPEWIAEEKYDGDRRIAQFCGRTVRFTGRRQSVKDGKFVEKTENVPHLSGTAPVGDRAFAPDREIRLRAPPKALDGTVLDGEMIYKPLSDMEAALPGGLSKYVTSIMGSDPEVAILKQIERGWLNYVVFDCLYFKGRDVRARPLAERRALAATACLEWNNPFATVSAEAGGQDKRRFLDGILARGGEGVVLKRLDHLYGDKNGWVKVKAEWTADVVIMGFEEAKAESVKKGDTEKTITKYAKLGLIGAIQCGQFDGRSPEFKPGKEPLIEVATVSGIDDQTRRDMTMRPKEYIGEVIEIRHNGREPTGRFRHPRFKRFRSDKKPSECVYREGEI